MSCPLDEEIALLPDANLPAATRAKLLAHLEGCERCRQVAAHLVAADSLVGVGMSTTAGADTARGTGTGVSVNTDVDGFKVLKELGSGAMGSVYEGWDTKLERRVALKFIRNPLVDESQLRDEARAMARLTHPNVVSIYDVRKWEGRTFLAMELVAGQTLRQWLDTPRTPREIIGVFLQAGEGLEAANAAGIVHRDFKPENVLIDAQGRVKVSDLGLARARTSDPTSSQPISLGISSSGKLIGTPAYMPPEQLRGERIDARADQFAFCAALAEALQGKRPWVGSTIEQLTSAIETTPPRLPTSAPPHVVKALERGLAAKAEVLPSPAMAAPVAMVLCPFVKCTIELLIVYFHHYSSHG